MTRSTKDKLFQLGMGDLQNTGLPITTAMLVAYEILKRSGAANVELADQKAALRLAKNFGDVAGTILQRIQIQGGVTIAREEPNDPTPGCVEDPGNTCDWPPDRRP